MNTAQLILITGMSGSGKSTLSQNLSRQYAMNGIEHRWLHEEIQQHPIRSGEFTKGSLESPEAFQENITDLYMRWEALVQQILHERRVYILEGCFYQNIIRYFFDVNYPSEKIMNFYTRLITILEPVRPVIVFLYSSDAKATLRKVFPLRGAWWKDLILDPAQNPYVYANGLSGEEGIYTMWQAYQALSNTIFQTYHGQKIKLDTVEGLWNTYLQAVTAFLGLRYDEPAERKTHQETLLPYCGIYRHPEHPSDTIEIHANGHGLYCKAFWDYMPLIPMAEHHYEIASFPIQVKFVHQGDTQAVQFIGEYDWDVMGKTFVRTDNIYEVEPQG